MCTADLVGRVSAEDELELTKLCAKLVPKNSNDKQKQNRCCICEDWLEYFADIFAWLMNCGSSSMTPRWKGSRCNGRRKGRLVPRRHEYPSQKLKLWWLVFCFFYCQGIILQEWVPGGQTVNAAYYIEVLKKLRARILRKPPELWVENNRVLHHDNAPTHLSLATRSFLAKHTATVIKQGPFRQQPTYGKIKFSLWQSFVLRLCWFVLKNFSFVLN